ncbi:hypothetical protein [Vibrio mexicanus]|uniref:hypothetical protein n=1 Tax=Vibrio mexicanus TaxID=1004326 RepID=UPI00063CA276|nr:hypothetical protein [Vibrio mexicanus]
MYLKTLMLATLLALTLAGCSDSVMPNEGESGKVEFDQLFANKWFGGYETKHPVVLGSVSVGEGVELGDFIRVEGLTIEQLKDKTIVVTNIDGKMIVKSVRHKDD